MKIILHTFFILLLSLTLNAQISDNSVETIASGSGSVAMGYQTEATAAFSTAMGIQSKATGPRSTAIGWLTQAQEYQSTAMGRETIASGNTSTAMGTFTTASGNYSTAMGGYSIASGNYSTAIGIGTIASDYASLAIGYYNLSGSNPTNDGSYSPSAVAFAIGNGTSSLDEDFFPVYNRSDALTVLFDGTTTVAGSITAPAFIGDGSQLTNLPSSGANSPFSYNSNEAGGIEVTNYTTASGSSAFAVGNDNLASGSSSTALGRGTIASGDDSTAIGANTEASGGSSTAMGQDTKAIGNNSTAMGWQTTASGTASTAMGGYTTASDYASVVIGQFNSSGSSATSATSFSTSNPAFVIGNGTGSDNRSDALTVLFDGTTTIAGDLNVNSDARLKANIVSLGSTLFKLLQIDGKSYTMKKDESEKQKIGLLAQDIEKVFPELVSESHGVKSVNYQGLVPVLINALKEQEDKIKSQEIKLLRLESLVQDLIDNQ